MVAVFVGGTSVCLLTLTLGTAPLEEWLVPGQAGALMAYSVLLSFLLPIGMFMTANMEKNMAGIERVLEYANMPCEPAGGTAPDSAWPEFGQISFECVSMRYRPELPLVLDAISFTVPKCTRVGIVGRTGAGKSSALLTLLRLVDFDGRILIDGVDTKTVPLKTLRSRIGVIPQDAWLFSGTLRSNLACGGDASDDEMWAMIELVELQPQIKQLGGLDYVLTEKGQNLSAGMKQLLCLARVLLRKPSILLMDEATASVDDATDKAVQRALREAIKGSLLVIAHRLHTIIDFDDVVVLQAGRKVEAGSPHELLEAGGAFANLVDAMGPEAIDLRARARAAQLGRGAAGAAQTVDLSTVQV